MTDSGAMSGITGLTMSSGDINLNGPASQTIQKAGLGNLSIVCPNTVGVTANTFNVQGLGSVIKDSGTGIVNVSAFADITLTPGGDAVFNPTGNTIIQNGNMDFADSSTQSIIKSNFGDLDITSTTGDLNLESTTGNIVLTTTSNVVIQDAIVTMKQRDGSTVDFNGNDIIHILRTIYSST